MSDLAPDSRYKIVLVEQNDECQIVTLPQKSGQVKERTEYFVHAFLAVIVYSFLPDRSLLEIHS